MSQGQAHGAGAVLLRLKLSLCFALHEINGVKPVFRDVLWRAMLRYVLFISFNFDSGLFDYRESLRAELRIS